MQCDRSTPVVHALHDLLPLSVAGLVNMMG